MINSLVLPVGKDVCDTRTYLEHNKGYCESRQLHKTVVSDRAKAVFNGMIKSRQTCDQDRRPDDQSQPAVG